VPVKIALIGRGLIGQAFLSYVRAADPAIEIAGALVRDKSRHAQAGMPLFGTLDELLAGRPDWVVECAGQAALAAYAAPALRAGCNVLAISSGALADEATLAEVRNAANEGRVQLVIPAGALPAVDTLAAAKHVGLTSVQYIRTAEPVTWVKAGALGEREAKALTAPATVFEGNARDAALRFPKNANVAATLALAGIGFERTRVQLVADPNATGNSHLIEAHGAFGTLRTSMRTNVIPGTSTSLIVAASLAQAMLSRTARIVV
jgi:aspartate dehydrogenase